MSTSMTREEKAARWGELAQEWGRVTKYQSARQDADGMWRDRYRKPLLPNADYTEIVQYDSPSGAGELIEDGRGLKKHEGRTGAMVVAHNEDIRDKIVASFPERLDLMTGPQKQQLDRWLEDGKDGIGAYGASNKGTTIHAWLEKLTKGEPLTKLPVKYKDLIDACAAVLGQYDLLGAEVFCVQPEMRFAGTLDARGRRKKAKSRKVKIIDYKSGARVLQYPKKTALQLAIYAHSKPVDLYTGETLEWEEETDEEEALLMHIPVDGTTAELYPMNIALAWELAAPAARLARDWQRLEIEDLLGAPLEAVPVADAIAEAIQAASTEQELVTLWSTYRATGWTPRHNDLARERKAALGLTVAA